MFARLFRSLDRLGYLVAKTGIWAGNHILAWAASNRWLASGAHSSSSGTDAAQVEGQIRSLSGLVVVLLASFATLILWATSPQAQSNPVIRLLTIGGASAPGDASGAAQPQSPPIGTTFQNTGGTVVFSMFAGAQEDLFALSAGQSSPVRLTDSPEDDRDPAWSPDGQHIAFASRRDGNWELYILTLSTGEITRLTYDLVFEAHPSWSPDGQWLAYEGYYDGNLDIYIIKADGSEERPYPVTRSPAPDFDPAWTTDPKGREIAYVSLKDGNQDIYILSLDDPSEDRAINVTHTPSINEDSPAWGPGGTSLAYVAIENGVYLIYALALQDANAKPLLVGQGHSPAWSPDGRSLVFLDDRPTGSLLLTGQAGAWDSSAQAFALPSAAENPTWSAAMLSQPLQGSLAFAATAPIAPAYNETLSIASGQGASYTLMSLPGVIAASDPFLSDQVDDSFIALKDYMNRAAGWDFLGRLDQVWWGLTQLVEPGQQYQNWHKAGRAFNIAQSYNQGNPPQIEVIQEQIGPEVYWRVFVRCAVQDGTLGEPLRQFPWDFGARFGGDVAAYDAGGRLKGSVPSGYYVDFTRAAHIFGWNPTASDSTWRYNWPGILYWQYEKRDGLDWWSAMLELYPEANLRQVFDTPTPGPTLMMTVVPVGTQPSSTQAMPQEKPTPTATPVPSRTPPDRSQ